MSDKIIVFFLVFGLATGFMYVNIAKAQNIVENGLVSYWSFDGGTAEDLFGDNDGTIEGSPAVVDGKVGDALEFDGVDDFVDMGDPADGSLDFGDEKDFSIAAWIKISEVSDQYTIVGKGDDGGNARLLFKVHSSHLLLTLANGAGNNVDAVESVADEEWHYVVAVTERKVFTNIYVDAELYAEGGPSNGANLDTEASFFIGKSHNDSTDLSPRRFFKGVIDEVCVYNRALSAEEVQQNFEAKGLAVSAADRLTLTCTWGEIKVLE